MPKKISKFFAYVCQVSSELEQNCRTDDLKKIWLHPVNHPYYKLCLLKTSSRANKLVKTSRQHVSSCHLAATETILHMQAGTCLLPRMNCDIAVTWHILPHKDPLYFLSKNLMTFVILIDICCLIANFFYYYLYVPTTILHISGLGCPA